MAWADAEVWKAIRNVPAALEEEALKELMFHIHFTQRAFFQVWRGDTFTFMKADAFDSLDAVYHWHAAYYEELQAWLAGLEAAQLAEPVDIPWSKFFTRQLGREVAATTLGETILQVCMHSVHHRAQVNTRLRVLGGTPPMIDYIAWLWAGRPARG